MLASIDIFAMAVLYAMYMNMYWTCLHVSIMLIITCSRVFELHHSATDVADRCFQKLIRIAFFLNRFEVGCFIES